MVISAVLPPIAYSHSRSLKTIVYEKDWHAVDSHVTVLHVPPVLLEHTKEGFTMGLTPASSVQQVTTGRTIKKRVEKTVVICNFELVLTES